jgi:hypothetical protein
MIINNNNIPMSGNTNNNTQQHNNNSNLNNHMANNSTTSTTPWISMVCLAFLVQRAGDTNTAGFCIMAPLHHHGVSQTISVACGAWCCQASAQQR